MIFIFDDYRVDSERYEYRHKHELQALEPQVFDLLVLLLANHDRIVSKDEIYANIWKNRIVSETTLSSRINAVRRAVGDSGEQQKLVKTLPRRGFRFIAKVEILNPSDQASSLDREANTEPTAPQNRQSHRLTPEIVGSGWHQLLSELPVAKEFTPRPPR